MNVSKIYTEKPTDERLPKEMRAYELLDSIGVSYERVDHDAAMTMEQCAEAKAHGCILQPHEDSAPCWCTRRVRTYRP